MSEHKDLRRKEKPMTQAEIQARYNKKHQVKSVGTVLALVNDDERALYERWSALPNKKEAFIKAMSDYFDSLDK